MKYRQMIENNDIKIKVFVPRYLGTCSSVSVLSIRHFEVVIIDTFSFKEHKLKN